MSKNKKNRSNTATISNLKDLQGVKSQLPENPPSAQAELVEGVIITSTDLTIYKAMGRDLAGKVFPIFGFIPGSLEEMEVGGMLTVIRQPLAKSGNEAHTAVPGSYRPNPIPKEPKSLQKLAGLEEWSWERLNTELMSKGLEAEDLSELADAISTADLEEIEVTLETMFEKLGREFMGVRHSNKHVYFLSSQDEEWAETASPEVGEEGEI